MKGETIILGMIRRVHLMREELDLFGNVTFEIVFHVTTTPSNENRENLKHYTYLVFNYIVSLN